MKLKKWLALALFVALCFQLAACATTQVDDKKATDVSIGTSKPAHSEVDEPAGHPPVALTGNGEAREPDAEFAAASAAFAAALLKNTAKGENTVISP